jgi:hypothetical protein
MKTFKYLASALALVIMSTGVASAEDSNWGVGVKAGTLGLGVEARWDGLPWLDFRAGANAYSLSDDGGQAGNVYAAEWDLETYFLTANFHVPLSPFRFTVGAMSNSNAFKMVGAETGDYTFDGQPFSQGEVGVLTGAVRFDDFAPYAGLGFDFELFGKAGLNFDLGVLMQGDPVVELSGTGTAWGGANFDAAVAAEQLELADEFDKFKLYPVVSLAFVYNF